MGKHLKETKAPRRHAFVEKAPVLAAIIIAGAGVFVSVMQAVSSAFIGVAFAAVYIRCGNLLVPMAFHVLTDIMAFATNESVSEGGVVTGTYKLGDAIDDVLCLILMIIGLWMLRSGVFEEIREIWNKKWKR
jgi:hypothetical protein